MPLVLQTETNPGVATFSTYTENSMDSGIIPMVNFNVNANPSAGQTFSCGADQYEFQPEGTPVAPGNIQIVLEATVNETRTNVLNAFNTLGTENIVALTGGSSLRVFPADAPGGNIIAASPDLLLDSGTLNSPLGWNDPNKGGFNLTFNFNTVVGAAPSRRARSLVSIEITADDFNNELTFHFPFVISAIFPMALTTEGLHGDQAYVPTDIIRITGDSQVIIGLVGDPEVPSVQIGDKLFIEVVGEREAV